MSLSPLVLALPRSLRSRDRTSTECCGQEDVRPCAPPSVDHHRPSTHPISASEAMKERRHRRSRTLHCFYGLVHRLVCVPPVCRGSYLFSSRILCSCCFGRYQQVAMSMYHVLETGMNSFRHMPLHRHSCVSIPLNYPSCVAFNYNHLLEHVTPMV